MAKSGRVGRGEVLVRTRCRGVPVFSYIAYPGGTAADHLLYLARCHDVSCAAVSHTLVGDSRYPFQQANLPLAFDGAGNPLIVYDEQDDFITKLARCFNPLFTRRALVTLNRGDTYFISRGLLGVNSRIEIGIAYISNERSVQFVVAPVRVPPPASATPTPSVTPTRTPDPLGGERYLPMLVR